MPLATTLVLQVLFGVSIALSLFGNTLVIAVVSCHRRLQTSMNCLLANLAIADFFVGLFSFPRTFHAGLYTHPSGLAGDILCKTLTNGNFIYLAAVASILILVFIAWERYFAVIHPLSSRGRINAKRLRLVVAVSWVAAFSLELIPLWVVNFNEEKKICFYNWSDTLRKIDVFIWCIVLGLVPLGVEACLYSRVVYRLWGGNIQTVNISERSLMLQRKKLTKVVLSITIVNVILCLPLDVYFFVECFAGKSVAVDTGSWSPLFKSVAHLMLVLNAACNPVIYAAQDRSFRRYIWRFLKKICCWKIPANNWFWADNQQFPFKKGKDGG